MPLLPTALLLNFCSCYVDCIHITGEDDGGLAQLHFANEWHNKTSSNIGRNMRTTPYRRHPMFSGNSVTTEHTDGIWSLPEYMSEHHFMSKLNALGITLNVRAVRTLNVSIEVPKEVQLVLSFGPKFSVPIPFGKEQGELLMRALTSFNDIHMAPYEQRTLTQLAKMHIRRMSDLTQRRRHSDKRSEFLTHCYDSVVRFFTENPQYMVAQADKGNISIIMPKAQYIEEVEKHLSDLSTYQPLSPDLHRASSHKGYARKNESILRRLAELKIIAHNRVPIIVSQEDGVPNMYGLVKLHKDGAPIRPVVNTRAGPGYTISAVLTRIFSHSRESHKYNVKNTTEFIDRISGVTPRPDEYLASFDVRNMFTNISVNAAINSLTSRHRAGKIKSNIPIDEIIGMLRFVISHATELEFNGRMYKQIRGLRMGSSLSTILSDMVMEDLLDGNFVQIQRPTFFTKYVDDCLVLAEVQHIREIEALLNAADTHVKFDTEWEDEKGQITYLDVQLNNTHEFAIITKWYSKPIASGRSLNYHSTHPIDMIVNTAKTQIFNMYKCTHIVHHSEVTDRAIELLQLNSFPHKLASRIMAEAYIKWRDYNTNSLKDSQRIEHTEELQETNPYEVDVGEEQINVFHDNRSEHSHGTASNEPTKTATPKLFGVLPHIPELTTRIQRELHAFRPSAKVAKRPMNTMRMLYDDHRNLRVYRNPLRRIRAKTARKSRTKRSNRSGRSE